MQRGFLVICLVVFALSLLACGTPTSQSERGEKAPEGKVDRERRPLAADDLHQLMDEYRADRNAAVAKNKGRAVSANGVVKEAKAYEDGSGLYVLIKVGERDAVLAEFANSHKDAVLKLKAGDAVSVRGILSGGSTGKSPTSGVLLTLKYSDFP